MINARNLSIPLFQLRNFARDHCVCTLHIHIQFLAYPSAVYSLTPEQSILLPFLRSTVSFTIFFLPPGSEEKDRGQADTTKFARHFSHALSHICVRPTLQVSKRRVRKKVLSLKRRLRSYIQYKLPMDEQGRREGRRRRVGGNQSPSLLFTSLTP